jgi:hypothetical protein
MAYEYVASGKLDKIVTMWARRSTLFETAKKYGRFSNLLHDVIIHDIDMFNLFAVAGSKPVRACCVGVRKACAKMGLCIPRCNQLWEWCGRIPGDKLGSSRRKTPLA